MHLEYKEVTESDNAQVQSLIDSAEQRTANPEHFIPYSTEERQKDNLFDTKNYAYMMGAYDGAKLAGISQLYVTIPDEFKEKFGFNTKTEVKIAELGGHLVLPEYDEFAITEELSKRLMDLAQKENFDYVVSVWHPDKTRNHEIVQKVLGMKYVGSAIVCGHYQRNLYIKDLHQQKTKG